MTMAVWWDGVLVDPSEPVLAATDSIATVGDGVFETMALHNGQPVALTRHLARLAYATRKIGLPMPAQRRIREGIEKVIEAAPGANRVRVTVTPGTVPLGQSRQRGSGHIGVLASQVQVPSECRAVRAPWPRNERSPIAGVKSASYQESVIALEYAKSKGADEALLANTQGHLCEGTTTNVLLELDGQIVTPPLSAGCLPGIVRGLALEWGTAAGLPVRVAAPGELRMSILDRVSGGDGHAAVSSSLRGIQPVVALDGVPVEPGRLLGRLISEYDRRISNETDPASPRV